MKKIKNNKIINDIFIKSSSFDSKNKKLIKENKNLPKNTQSINTPYGTYYPDFELNGNLIEIKSLYTYEVLIGKVVNRWSNKIDTTQYNKIRWVNENVTKVNILVIDKRNNKIINKEIK